MPDDRAVPYLTSTIRLQTPISVTTRDRDTELPTPQALLLTGIAPLPGGSTSYSSGTSHELSGKRDITRIIVPDYITSAGQPRQK